MAATDALPIPKKNTAYRHYFCIRKDDGSLITNWTGADTEISQDGGTMADATNEATEIATTSGCGYIDLTAGEMNYDSIVVKVTVTNANAIPYVVALFPEESGDIRVDVTEWDGTALSTTDPTDAVTLANGAHGGAAASITLSSYTNFQGSAGPDLNILLAAEITSVTNQTTYVLTSGSDKDDAYNNQMVIVYDDSNSDYPSIHSVVDYVGSTKTLTISEAPNFTVGADDSIAVLASPFASELSVIDGKVDQVIDYTDTLEGAIAALPDNTTDIQVIKSKTDQLVFSATGAVDCNVIALGDTLLTLDSIASWHTFYDYTSSTKTVNDVGVAGTPLAASDVWTYVGRSLDTAVETDAASRTASKADVTDMLTATVFNAALPTNFGTMVIDVSGTTDVNIIEVTGTAVTDINDFKGVGTPGQITIATDEAF